MNTTRPGLTEQYNDFYAATDFEPYPDPVNRRYLRCLLQHAGVPDGARVLDVGCGTGYYTAALRTLGCLARGLDISEVAVERARSRYPDIRFDVRDALAPPADDERYDALFVQGFSHLNVADPDTQHAQYAHLLRYLAPGGTLISVGGSRLPVSGYAEGGWYQHSWKELLQVARIPGAVVDGPYASHEYLFLLPSRLALSTLTTDILRSVRMSRSRRIIMFIRREET